MAEELVKISTDSKEIKYTLLFPQIEALIAGEPNIIARLANISAALKRGWNSFGSAFTWWKTMNWYLVHFKVQ